MTGSVGIVDVTPTPALPRYQTASGAIVNVDAPGYDLTHPWFHSFRIRVEAPYAGTAPTLRERAFQIGPVGTIVMHAQHILKGAVEEEFSALGGTMVIARNAEGLGIAGWRGRWHEMYMWLNVPKMTARDVLGRYDRLTLLDSPLGLRVRTGTVPKETVYAEEVVKHVPNTATMTIHAGRSSTEVLPTWSGAKVRSGEVWRREVSTDGGTRNVFMHANRSAVTVLDEAAAGDADSIRLRFLDAITSVSWTTS